MKPLVYCAAPYIADNDVLVELNKAYARVWARAINRTGKVFAILPHNLGEQIEASLPDDQWYALTMSVMLRCDAVVMLPGWQRSVGCVAEHEAAHAAGMPILVARALLKLPNDIRELVREIEHVEAMRRAAKISLPKDET